jgi:hypothetical protein
VRIADNPEGTITRKVRVSETLAMQLQELGVEWGQPDAEGFYTPTLRSRTEIFTQAAVDARAGAARLREIGARLREKYG